MTKETLPTRDKSPLGIVRDTVAFWIINLGLRVATPWYARMLTGLLAYGMQSVDKDFPRVEDPDE